MDVEQLSLAHFSATETTVHRLVYKMARCITTSRDAPKHQPIMAIAHGRWESLRSIIKPSAIAFGTFSDSFRATHIFRSVLMLWMWTSTEMAEPSAR